MEKKNSTVFVVCLQFLAVLPAALSAAPAAAPGAAVLNSTSTIRDEAVIMDLQAKCQKGQFNFLDFAAKYNDCPAELRPALASNWSMIGMYFACLASMPEPKQGCEAIRGYHGMETFINDCRRHTSFFTMIRKAFQSGDAASECQKRLSPENIMPEKDLPRLCAMLAPALKTEGTAGFCAKVQAAGISFKPGHSCAAYMHFLTGGAACDSAQLSGEAKRRCREDAALLKGLRSGDARTCAASPLCDAIANKNARACEAYLAGANKEICGRVAPLARLAESNAARRREAQLKEAATPTRVSTIQQEEEARRAALSKEDPETAAKKAKMAQEVAAAKAAALKKSEAEAARHKMISDIRQQRKAAQLPKNEPPPQFKKGTPLQRVPPEVQKRIEAAERQRIQDGQ